MLGEEKNLLVVASLPGISPEASMPRPSAPARQLADFLDFFRTLRPQWKDVELGSPYKQFHGFSAGLNVLALKHGLLDALISYLCEGGAPNSLDPRVSAPAVVAEAASALSLSPDAACYYLQLLALPTPADAIIRELNGWSAHEFEAASAALADASFIQPLKRSGAGRSSFLPGAWLEKSSTGPGIEEWKAPDFYAWEDVKFHPLLHNAPITRPPHLLFAHAWQRIKAGDTPQRRSLETKTYRR